MELDEQPLEWCDAFPLPFSFQGTPPKNANDDSERREDDQGKVRLHLTLGNNQNGGLPQTFKAQTAIFYEINKYSYNLAPFSVISFAAAQPAPFPLAPLSSTCALYFSEITSVSFIATRTGIAYSKLHKEKFEKLIFFQPSHESNLLFPVTL